MASAERQLIGSEFLFLKLTTTRDAQLPEIDTFRFSVKDITANCLGLYGIKAAGDVNGQKYSILLYGKVFKYTPVYNVILFYPT